MGPILTPTLTLTPTLNPDPDPNPNTNQVELAISMAESRRDVDVLKAKIGALKAAARDAEDASAVEADDRLPVDGEARP